MSAMPNQPAALPQSESAFALNGQSVSLAQVRVKFGDFTAVEHVSLEIAAGEFFSFLGPSGCGKTTLLRLLSGFEDPTAGEVFIGGQNMRGVSPNRRPTAMIFQNLALFPLMTVWENVAFGLEARGVNHRQRRLQAEALLDLVALTGEADKRVTQLSGGQKQRVAIARALAVRPSVLLLDEPLSALDLKLRQHMRAELRDIQRRTGVTFIYITHDQGEALTMSDRVAVMRKGRIEQVATPVDLYDHPATPFVATFVGENNPIDGQIVSSDADYAQVQTTYGLLVGRNPSGLRAGQSATLFVRPERIRLQHTDGAVNTVVGKVLRVDFEGAQAQVHIHAGGERSLLVQMSHHDMPADCRVGVSAQCCFDREAAVILAPGDLAS